MLEAEGKSASCYENINLKMQLEKCCFYILHLVYFTFGIFNDYNTVQVSHVEASKVKDGRMLFITSVFVTSSILHKLM